MTDHDAPAEGRRFLCEGKVFMLETGRTRPGLPTEHIVAADGKHISLAYPEAHDRPSVLYDADVDGARVGFRLYLDTLHAERFKLKAEYYRARTDAGWPCYRRKAKAKA